MPNNEKVYGESLPLVRSTQNIISGKDGDAYKPETDIKENGTNDKQVFSNYANKPYSPAESVLEVSLESYPYYHVSKDPNLSIMEPRLPQTPRKYIDTKKPRVHFASSIQQALMSLGRNLTDEEFFVYVPVNNSIKVFTPFINQIPEVKVTGEVWFTQPVAVRCLGKIKVSGSTDKSHIYKLGDSVNELYEWSYRKIDNEGDTDGFHLNPEEDLPLIEQANFSETQKHPVFIVLQHSGTLLSNLIKTATGDTYTHACISFNPELDPIYSFGNKGADTLHADPGFVIQNQKAPFFKNYTVKYAVYVMYVDDKAYKDMQRCLNIFIENKNKLKYDFLNLLSAWFGVASEKSERYFCARFVAKIIDAGYKLNRVPSLWKPEDFRSLNNITLVNQGSNFRLYDPRVTRKNMLYVQVREFDRLKYKIEDFPKDDPILMPVAASVVDWNVDGKAINESEELELPSRDRIVPMLPDIQTILDRTPTDCIWLTSDWHLFKNHYKKEANYVNMQEIVKWCREHIKDTDIFMYLGDLSFRYANKQDQLESQKIMAKIPGIKVLILGNHDLMLGQDYFKACGFDYVFESLRWKHLIFTHRPINMDSDIDSESLNIHGHIHNIRTYNTTDGKRNINVYPLFYDNKPANLKYILSHVEELTKNNEWNPNYMYDEATFGDMYDSLYSPSMSSLEIEPISEAAYKKRSFQSNSRTTKIDDDFKANGHYDLSNYRCIDVTSQVYEKYASKTNCMTDCVFGLESYHKDPKGWQNDVSMKLWLDGDKPVAYLEVSSLNKRKTGGARSIHVIKIDRQYRGYGLSKQIIDYAVKRLKANWAFLMKRNEIGLKIFKDYGFKINAFDKKDYESADRICLSYGLTKWYSSEYPTIEWESKVVTNLNSKVLQIMREQSNVRQKPIVYFSRNIDSNTIAYMVSLFQQRLGNRVAIKLHFGESGNKNFLKPELLKRLTQELNASLVDCNAAYEGSTRLNTADHIETAKRHGFTFGYVDILDADGELELSVPRRFMIQNELMEIANGKKPYECHVTPGKHLESIRVGSHIRNYDSLIVYTHFKGHTMAGFGGSIKNIGMGMASGLNGKKQIHDDWCGGPLFLERLVESASAIESVFDNRTVYVNVLANLSLECDCDKDAPKPTMPDIGILVSDDIVAIEQASWDLIRYNYKNGEFLQQVSDKSGYHQIEYAKWLGMGSTQYNLRDLSNNLLKLESSKIASELIFEEGNVKWNDNFKAKETFNLSLYKVVINPTNEVFDSILNVMTTDESKKYIKELRRYHNWCAEENKKTDRHMEYLIWLDNNNLVAYAIVQKFNDGVSYLTPLVISESYRGHGLSKQIMNLLISKYDVNELTVEKDNKVAIELYKKLGFTFTHKYDKETKGDTKHLYMIRQSTKQQVQEEWRAELPDKSFGIPEDRKFPLDSEQHVRSAIKLFGHAQEDKKKKLARRIASVAKKYNIDIPQSTQCYKYLHEATMSQVIPEGIKNIIFDFGKVLVDVNLNKQIKEDKDIPSELADELIQQYFSILFIDDDSKLAHENDLLTIEQAKAKFDQSVPEHLKPYTDEVFKCVETSMSLYPHTLPILSALKAKGYRLFYLSNWPRFSFDSMAPYFAELIPNFEGGIISCDVGLLKPEREIYAKLLNDYGLLSEECLFFDDKQENLEPAEKFFGMKVHRFDYKETPQILMGELNLKPIEPPHVENMIMVMPKPGDPEIDPNSQPKTLEISRFKNWILSKTPIDTDVTPVNRNEFYMTLNIAVTVLTQEIANDPNEDKMLEQPYPYKRYVYVNQDALLRGKSEEIKLVYVGRIVIKNDGTYEWELQLPVYINGDGLLSSITQPTSTTEAMALASINPIMGWNNHLLINTGKQYVYTQDPDSENGLIVNEDGILEVINTHNLPIKEMYRFVGDKGYIAKLAQAYKESARVESLYSVLTGGKTLLTEDQFMFDESFSRVDFDLLEQRVISELATLKDEIIAVSNGNNKSWSTFNEFVNVEKPSFIDKYNTCGDISIREDFDGYYFYSDLNHKRSMSVPFVSMLTENMLNSII